MENLPTWSEAHDRVKDGTATPLDVFINNHEPAGMEDERHFRSDLKAALEYVFSNKPDPNAELVKKIDGAM